MARTKKSTLQKTEKMLLAKPTRRADGMETRATIIECAGRLFAKNGFDKTTSKSICEKAKVNLASVNYYFGSREGLYIAVLEEIHDRITQLTVLSDIKKSSVDPQEKVERLLDFFIANLTKKNAWTLRLWSRELLAPTPYLQGVIRKKVLPKFSILVTIFSNYLGYSPEDIRLYAAILNTMSPFVLVFLGQNSPLPNQVPIQFPKELLLKQLRNNAMTVLASLRNSETGRKYSEKASDLGYKA